MARSRVVYQDVDEDYLQHRSLKKGAAGWILLAGLGVSYVISGDFAGWNFGLDEGGWGGLLIATILMGLMYTCMVFGLAEMSSALPVAGAGYGFARRALGPIGGFATGMAVLIEYAVAPAAISMFIGGYVEALGLFGLTNGWPVYLIAYVVFIGVHLYGVGEALKLMFGITAIAVVALVAAVIGLAPEVLHEQPLRHRPGRVDAVERLPALRHQRGRGRAGLRHLVLPRRRRGAAGRRGDRHPKRDMPRGIIAAMLVLLVFAALMLLAVPGAAGSAAVRTSDNPLPEAIRAVYGSNSLLADFVNYAGLAGLIASFFSIIYAYSRQLFALSRAGYLPKVLSLTSGRKTPWVALIVPGHDRLRAGRDHQGRRAADQHRRLRRDDLLRAAEPEPHHAAPARARPRARLPHARRRRHHRARPGAQPRRRRRDLLRDVQAPGSPRRVFVGGLAYFWFYSRHHLVASAPEEEFARSSEAEPKLK